MLAVGITEPIAAVLRTAMRGWVGYLDEMMIDRIIAAELNREVIVELAAASLVSTLRTARALDSSIDLDPSIIEALNKFDVREDILRTKRRG
ncbi:hypothetical protein [Mycolicibacter icosiumassiliensis]|uniref:hypothetical protein n=1 Tax=Mycolicibacter icosiumassiliensis TaxID=1792835 RepID=UPI000834F755|nr:hypothetical protein [Mycolicibacter icosiumassiliensis]